MASLAAIIIVLNLTYFYKTRFKHGLLEGQQGLVRLVVFLVCYAATIILLV